MDETVVSLKDKIAQLDSIIEQFHGHIELPAGKPNKDVEHYLNMSRTEIEAMTPDQTAVGAHEINIYRYYLRKQINKCVARKRWCESELKRVFGQEARHCSAYSYEEKKATIICDNEYARKLHDFHARCESMADSVYGISEALKDVADSFKSIQFVKRDISKNFGGF